MKVKNWAGFQHYRDGRSLHWIKLYRTLLDNYDFAALSGDDAKVLILCWLVAAEKDGELPDTPALAFRLRMDPKRLGTSLHALVLRGFLESVESCTNLVRENTDTSEVVLPRERVEGETEREGETEAEGTAPAPNFDTFWTAYPRKVGKGAALAAWKKAKPSRETVDAILKAVEAQKHSRQWLDSDGRFIPNPATWLNQARWQDETETKGTESWI